MTAVIFDLDGVLVDSEPLWQQGFVDVINDFCVEQQRPDPGLARRDMSRFHGGRVKDTIKALLTEQGLADRLTDEVVATLTGRVVEHAAAHLSADAAIAASVTVAKRLHELGVRLAVASSSAERFIDAVIVALGLEGTFDVVQSALDLEHGKPHPEVYTLALARLRAPAASALAIEDSVPGVQSALRAGLSVVWLTATPPREARASLGDLDSSGVRVVTDSLDYDQVRGVLETLT